MKAGKSFHLCNWCKGFHRKLASFGIWNIFSQECKKGIFISLQKLGLFNIQQWPKFIRNRLFKRNFMNSAMRICVGQIASFHFQIFSSFCICHFGSARGKINVWNLPYPVNTMLIERTVWTYFNLRLFAMIWYRLYLPCGISSNCNVDRWRCLS